MESDHARLTARRARVAAALGLTNEILLVGAGHPVAMPESTDQTYPYRSHADYFYLTGEECLGGVLAFDPRLGPRRGWVSFVPKVTESEKIWDTRKQPPGVLMSKFGPWLKARTRRPRIGLGSPVPGVGTEARASARARESFLHARRPKDAPEIKSIRQACAATIQGFALARRALQPGLTERGLQIELEAEFFRGGADRPGYGTIIGGGPQSGVLHSSPTSRRFHKGEFVLIDAGAEVNRYVADVTRTYVVGGKPGAFQQDLHQLVRTVEKAAIARCLPGAEWKEIHLAAAVELTAGLVAMKVMRGNAETLVERQAHRIFFPHGIGHLVGLGVRDASGRLPGRRKNASPALENLRMDLPLATGYVTTVEPGIYFIPTLLQDPVRRRGFRDCVNWRLAEEHIATGGVRLEDTILVTEHGPENLTASIPLDA